MTLVDEVSSDLNGTTTFKEVEVSLSEGLNFSAYHYYVRVEMDRNDTGDDARFYGVSLETDVGF